MRQAARRGIEAGLIHRWLRDHLAHPAPPLMASAIDAWLKVGKSRPLELADAVLLHVPDRRTIPGDRDEPAPPPLPARPPGSGLARGQEGDRKELAALLQELGFTVIRDLIHDELARDGKAGREAVGGVAIGPEGQGEAEELG